MKFDFNLVQCVVGLAVAVSIAADPSAARAQDSQPAPGPGGAEYVAPPQSFTIEAIDVVGVTKLKAGEVERIVYPFMGPGKTPADVEAARKAIQDAYARAGYEATVVEVPPQPQDDFALGLVQIKVGEAPVGVVKVSEARHHSAAMVLRQLPSIRPGEPLNFKSLQQELAAANRFPDREIVPAFDAGAQPGTIDVNLKVRDSLPVHASVELNNDNSPNTTPLRASGSARYTNLWGVGHTLTVGAAVAPQNLDESKAFFGSYFAPVIGSRWTFAVSGYQSNSNIAALGGTNVLGNGFQVGVQAIYRLPADRDYHAFRIGVDYKDFKQDIGLRGTTVSNSPIRYVPLTLGYNVAISRNKTSFDASITGTLGLRVIKRIACFDPAATVCLPEDQFTNREIDSTENFAHINIDASLTQVLGGDWVGVARFAGQFADSHLVSNEQFAIGGLTTVRGYFQSEVVGDRGMVGSLELRAPSLATRVGNFVDELRLFAFVDGGFVSLINPLPDVQSRFNIASIGGGLRVKLLGHFSGEVLGSYPLLTTTDTQRGDPRVTFSVKGEF